MSKKCPRCNQNHYSDPFFISLWREIEEFAIAYKEGKLDYHHCSEIEHQLDHILGIQVLQLASKEAECLDKRPYATEEIAQRAAESATERLGDKIVFYKCTWCDFYHIGHYRKKKSQSKDVKWWQRADAVIHPRVRKGRK